MNLEENVVVADRFRLVRMIGRGGMGSVWRAFDTRLDVACAVKFIEGELAHVAEAHARFQREARAAAALRSPHVVEIKDHGVWQGTPYIAMELLEGEDLGKVLASAGGRLPPAQVVTVVEQVCRALTKAHQAGIVHRDLKPDNVFIVDDDDRQLVKILDFGVAKSSTGGIDGSNTKTGAMLGTPYYMSPEQAQGVKTIDSRSDLWSLAVIVYQCLTGRLPFESEALGDLLVKIIVHPIPVPSQIAVVPPGFDVWWAKAADRDPDGRFQTAKELGASLALALGTCAPSLEGDAGSTRMQAAGMVGTSQVLGPVTPNPYAPPLTPTHRTPAGVAMPRAGSAPSQPSLANPATFAGVEPPATLPKKGAPVGVIAGVIVALLAVGGAGVFMARRGGEGAAAATSAAPSAEASVIAAPAASAASPPVDASAAASVAPPDETPEPEAKAAAPAQSASGEPVASAAPSAPSVERGGQKPVAPTKGASIVAPTRPGKTPATAPPSKKMNLDLGI